MTPEELKTALEARGWKARIESAPPNDIVRIKKTGLFKCVDGRASEASTKQNGPKALGGIYALACLRGKLTEKSLAAIVDEVRKAGYVPSVHGDAHGPTGCGFFKLWKTGQLPGRTPPSYDGMTGRRIVLDAKGEYEWLKGSHDESYTIINLRKNTTFEPVKKQRFVLDAWIAEQFKLNIADYATLAAVTVEKLRPAAMVARIVV